jgi:flagellar biosynthesis/type III secretory pathway protein FliH
VSDDRPEPTILCDECHSSLRITVDDGEDTYYIERCECRDDAISDSGWEQGADYVRENEIENMREQITDEVGEEAWNQGREEGYNEGFDAGKDEGYYEGKEEAMEEMEEKYEQFQEFMAEEEIGERLGC